MGPAVQELRAFLDFLRKKDLKFTSQRELILKAVFTGHRHFTADQLFEEVRRKDRTISRATVYRTLALLAEANLVEANDFDRGQLFYERKFGYEHHDHLICIDCGKIIEFKNQEIERIQDQVTQGYAFKPLYHRHQIFGQCHGCCKKGAGRNKN